MAKSIRAKAKMAARKKKREESHYGVTDAARTARLSAKLLGKGKAKAEPSAEGEGAEDEVQEGGENDVEVKMEDDAEPTKISTSGSRGSRRQEWQQKRGLPLKTRNKTIKLGGRHVSKPNRQR